MIKKYSNNSLVFLVIVMLAMTPKLHATVNDITGDTGSAQSGSLTLTGGTSGLLFDSSTTSITAKVNFINMPLTSSTTGQIMCASNTILHNYGEDLQNIFVGDTAGNFTLTGGDNTGCGGFSLNVLTSGSQNVAVGQSSFVSLTSGNDNVAVGYASGSGLTTGGTNSLIGAGAGSAYTGNESFNIIIGGHPGARGESQITRISNGGNTAACFIVGIYGATVDPNTALPVYVDAVSTLGTVASSARFKKDIKPIGNDSTVILDFSPVSFTLKSDTSKTKLYGLIAEDVFRLMPELVVKKQNKPYAVKYHELPVLLLNELQKLEQRVKLLEEELTALKAGKGN